MSASLAQRDTGMSVSFAISTVLHLAVFLLLALSGRLFPPAATIQDTYYVDVVTLPVADPHYGTSVQTEQQSEPAAPPPTPAAPLMQPKTAMPAPAVPAKPTPHTVPVAESSDTALAERMAQLEQSMEARREAAVLERLRIKVKTPASGRAGMPNARGSQSGSDYTAYIQSRLKDAFRETISYSSSNPEMVVRLYIDGNGRLTRRASERSSNDKAFELAVQRAIDLASEKFPPPPDKKVFEGVFVFKPQGISPTRSR